ncbi:MAG: preprotein translocase subunit SecY [bacterium]|nr:preprotein translocase subunit SecY [bacterium]
MINSIINPLKAPDLRNRLLFTAALIVVFRVGAFIPTPGINGPALADWFHQLEGTVFGFLNLFSGGAFEKFSIFSLGIMPYISASIILQLFTIVFPYYERLSKEGEQGKKKITQHTRYGTILISIVQALGVGVYLQSQVAPSGEELVYNPGISFLLMTVLTLSTGTAFIMWLGEQISDRGIGNGISLIIAAGIIASIPGAISQTATVVLTGEMSVVTLAFILIVIVLVTAAVVIMLQGQRRIPVQYAKRVVGRKVYGGQSTHIPLQINPAGVIPVIFASAILDFPRTIAVFFSQNNPDSIVSKFANIFQQGHIAYSIVYFAFIVFFTYFYTAVVFKPDDVADNMRKYGGFVPGIRPGKPTADYIEKVLSRILLVGAMFLAVIALLPSILYMGMKIPFWFGGTSLLIVIGVVLDTVKQIESQLLMTHYEGFLKKGKLRGRR